MIHNLDTIPYKLFVKISETNNYLLLSDTETDIDILKNIWDDLHTEHLNNRQTSQSKHIFKLSKSIDSLLTLNRVVIMACECLRFELNNDIEKILVEQGYSIDKSNTIAYHNSIDLIKKAANSYIIKAENYKNTLPVEDKLQSENKHNVDDVMASYCTILGFNIGDFNTITYNAFYGYEKQVTAKINAINQQNKTNSNGK